jgi:antibiotic biosynthesis monooxygenase (ABM) superfamily enzyme
MIKVIVERKVKKGNEVEFHQLLREVKSAATLYPGYISGETLTAVDDPRRTLVVANFTDMDSFKKWQDNPDRLKIVARLEALLEYPPVTSIYKMA